MELEVAGVCIRFAAIVFRIFLIPTSVRQEDEYAVWSGVIQKHVSSRRYECLRALACACVRMCMRVYVCVCSRARVPWPRQPASASATGPAYIHTYLYTPGSSTVLGAWSSARCPQGLRVVGRASGRKRLTRNFRVSFVPTPWAPGVGSLEAYNFALKPGGHVVSRWACL